MRLNVTAAQLVLPFSCPSLNINWPSNQKHTHKNREGEDSSVPIETRSSRRSSQTFDYGTGIQPARLMDGREQDDEDTSNEMQEFRGISYMDPSPGSCSATQPSCGFDSGGGGDATGATLNVEFGFAGADDTCGG
jgi:hypothetical protein